MLPDPLDQESGVHVAAVVYFPNGKTVTKVPKFRELKDHELIEFMEGLAEIENHLRKETQHRLALRDAGSIERPERDAQENETP